MKKNFYIIAVLAIIMSACCKGPYPIATLSISYPNLAEKSELKTYISDRNDISNIYDTVVFGELNESNSFTYVIEFDENSANYILFIDSTSYSDTISEIAYRRKSDCKETIEDFQYRLNGELRSDNKLTIE